MSAGREPSSDLRAVIDSLPVIVWMLAPDGRLVYVNRAGREYVGVDHDGTGEGWADVVHPDDRARAASGWPGPQSAPEGWEAEFRLRRHDGQFRRALVRARPVRDEAGVVSRWVGTVTDVEDERRMGDELRRQALDIGLVLAAAVDAADHERRRLARQLRAPALEPLEAAARSLQEAGHAEESAAVMRAVKALRDALEH